MEITDLPVYCPANSFITPPECRGQMVELSYATDPDSQVIIERAHDKGDNTVSYCAYDFPRDEADCWDGDWSPWNGTPELGECLGECFVDE